MANIKEVAARAEVSTTTVSHVINETRFVAQETRERVFAAMRELNPIRRVRHYGVEAPQPRHHLQTVAQDQPLVSNAFFSNDGHRSPRCFVIHDAGG